MGVGQTNLTGQRGPLARPQGIIRWRVSGTKYVRQRYVRRREAFPKFAGWRQRGRGKQGIQKTNLENENFRLGPGAHLRIMLGVEAAGSP